MNEQSQTEVNQTQENKTSDKELNFRALESRFQRQLDLEIAARREAERVIHELTSKRKQKEEEEEEDDDEPYVNKKKLTQKLNKFGENNRQQTQKDIQLAVQDALKEERKKNWLDKNKDFNEVMTHENGERFHQYDPELAESLFQIPDEFERMKVVYKNIKALGLDKSQQKKQSIQDKIDANQRSPYYQPSGTASAPYESKGDFSEGGKKQAYEKMQALKSKLNLG